MDDIFGKINKQWWNDLAEKTNNPPKSKPAVRKKYPKGRLSKLQRRILEEAVKVEDWIKEGKHLVELIQPDGNFQLSKGDHPADVIFFPGHFRLDGWLEPYRGMWPSRLILVRIGQDGLSYKFKARDPYSVEGNIKTYKVHQADYLDNSGYWVFNPTFKVKIRRSITNLTKKAMLRRIGGEGKYWYHTTKRGREAIGVG